MPQINADRRRLFFSKEPKTRNQKPYINHGGDGDHGEKKIRLQAPDYRLQTALSTMDYTDYIDYFLTPRRKGAKKKIFLSTADERR